MPYYAHTATKPDGTPDPDESKWQPLDVHLRNVADLAAKFAAPFGASHEAYLAGLLHDLGKYAARFQARLHDNSIHGINHWAAGAAHAGGDLKQFAAAFAVDGHHTGIPSLGDGLKQTVARMFSDETRAEFTRCKESIPQLLGRLRADGLALPVIRPRRIDDSFAEAFHTRMLFSCLVDADFLDTEAHFDPTAAA